ncbi:MAG: DVUA0089 family protein [Fimbriimonadales bacterium]|nr:DVUA0089 family protein [Fimbriimonadales bacterium]
MRRTIWALLTIGALSLSAQAQTWTEQGDAGDLPETAQSTGSGSLTQIRGTLDVNDVDMYAIYISDPANFSASTVGGATWDTQLFLFDANGRGVVSEDDTVGLQSTINNANGCIPAAGLYYLAITRYNKDPLGCNEGGLWSFNDNNCPNGPEATSRVASWTTSTGTAGGYTISLTGVQGATAGDPADCPPFPGWDEFANGGGDAGDMPETAQSTGTGALTAIRGTIGAANDVDIYAIYITDPSSFSATTVGGTTLDTALWLFDANGKGVVHNEDNPDATTGFQSRIDNRTPCITQPGLYYLAISLFGRRAAGCNEGLIWATTPTRGVRCPDGVEPTSRLASWSGTTASTGTYRIFLTGAQGATRGDPADCPPPAPWDEAFHGGGDAGDLPATAQIVNLPDVVHCETPVQRVRGDLGADDVDMYVICITDPGNFVASTVGQVTWDTQLWLFRCDGTGVVHNDDEVGGTSFQSRLDNTAGCITAPGIYLLAISRYNRDPVDAGGARIWNDSPFRSLRCPDGPGMSNPITGWTGTTTAAGRYIITLQGAYFVRPSGCEEPPGCQPHNGDVINNGCVDDADLLAVLFAFGSTGQDLGRVDVNCDQAVDDADLLIVLFNFGSGCE